MNKEEQITLATRWFVAHGIPVSEDDGSLFIDIRKESIQISSAEVAYRADLQAELDLEPLTTNH